MMEEDVKGRSEQRDLGESIMEICKARVEKDTGVQGQSIGDPSLEKQFTVNLKCSRLRCSYLLMFEVYLERTEHRK